eukprot:CAMPEP_0181201498 /NCGR_PEP_ID=MMETSP1096-20121128/18340_1 /TAXON_ID=156174 ORGANISM="Chrysochromulina ericina, Strain CCMP281" /NCGR_SAMPLE_ID=MMETSP1096 /ASSEMBLY_ACC=CAM_ASM_000453 /LENGTH=47 /DNA_ID= /DNA_START= /DNA_END= /DNA_ORIENTATION=
MNAMNAQHTPAARAARNSSTDGALLSAPAPVAPRHIPAAAAAHTRAH